MIKKKIKEYDKFILYEYIFDNGNSYKETIPKWKQRDFSTKVKETQEDKLDNQLDKMWFRR